MGKKATRQRGRQAADPAGAGGGEVRRLLAAGLAQQRAGRLAEAERAYARVLELDPANADARYFRATVYLQTGRRQAGISELGAAIERAPDNPGAFYSLGAALAEEGRLEEAVAACRAALRLKPDFPQAHNNLGIVFQRQGRLDEAVASYRAALRLAPDNPQALNNLGAALRELGRLEEAVASFRAALRLAPDYPQAHNNLGAALRELGQLDEAVASCREALRLAPEYPEALNNLGNALAAQGRPGEAAERYREALRLAPGYREARANLGNALTAQGELEQAVACYRAVLDLKPDDPDALYNLGNALTEQGRLDEAAASYRAALDLKPDFPDACANLGIALTVAGRLDEAQRAFERAVALAPTRGAFQRMLADTGRVAPDSPQARRLEELAADVAGLPETDRMEVHFALGALYADAGLPERSFAHLLEANRLKRGRLDYDEAATLALFGRIRAVFSAGLLAGASGAGAPSRLPVFVVGMPRSGTTLVEQILASHPRVFGAGELLDLQRAADDLSAGGLGFPEAAAGLPRQDFERLGAAYLERVQARAPSAERIVDKLPDNFLRLGLIRLALPGARIIHVVRDPVDTCLSCFSKLFTDEVAYAYDLAELGRYYRAYAGLMEHWRAVLPPQVLCEVRYEDVVADLEGQARRLLDHCGLDWDARCLDFHRSRRAVRTASAAQVRRPLYASSVGRWGAFADLARPLLAALGGEAGSGAHTAPGPAVVPRG
jgi:tetratricopeptide (TPR) repeat protein